ncbi:DUF2141 domain-containing protein [Aureisphaera sp. CAU 1614]|uniref:DUF2141 domain-containing protein n=1 Tax=Halomarinibacterium sedimenti TaxID=2857106 RepID=A0A9X1FPB3_9FLAO|nr:DUF2141 domain-containing protein [Halomarinibacterium sedimenti]MAL61097.1 hypothetical protein [Flavobacteriaceae bacterium]MBW2938229.1 DUF2141 domain-containing protein [Halomarinibacterium sedimenti]HAT66810.1 hypothetical protein [Flavobacteriaceae bacterium]|tara:strand:+ start:164870 stop:165283 length:414 start_codon:yes stop_codon:yes gene_type:complete
MQTVLHFLTLLLTGMLLQAQNTVEVTMTHFGTNDGKARVGLYNQAEDFLNKEFKTLETVIVNQKATVAFTDVPDGMYAISCYHDEDNNGQLNMRFGMIPIEDYGCSNGAKGFFGPPKWEDAQFEVKGGEVKSIAIKL